MWNAKKFSLFGVEVNREDEFITILDNDIVEKSNLNGLFLFLKNNIGKYKGEAAYDEAKIINKSTKFCLFEKNFFRKDKIFTNIFWKWIYILISIDSQSGMGYLDKKANIFEIPMFLGAILEPLAKIETFA